MSKTQHQNSVNFDTTVFEELFSPSLRTLPMLVQWQLLKPLTLFIGLFLFKNDVSEADLRTETRVLSPKRLLNKKKRAMENV
jgi:hypothetical protein